MKISRRWMGMALVALALGSPARATDPKAKSAPRGPRPFSQKLSKKSYPVAKLVETLAQGPAGASGADLLVRAVVSAVKPTSWEKRGGAGTIEYSAQSKSLVINQTTEVHGRIAAVLKALSMIQPKQKVPAALTPAAYSPSPSAQHKQYGHFVMDNVRVNAMGVSCTIRRIRFLYKGDGIDADVAKCAMTNGESEKKADVPKVLTDLLEKVSTEKPTPPTATPCLPVPCVGPVPTCPAITPTAPPADSGPQKTPDGKAKSNKPAAKTTCTCP